MFDEVGIIALQFYIGRCYCLVADGITTDYQNYQIIKKAEIAFLNERVRSINNSLAMFTIQRDTCINQLKDNLDKETMERCERFIKEKREIRHLKTFQ